MLEGRETEEENQAVMKGIYLREVVTSDGTWRISGSRRYSYHHRHFVSRGLLVVRKV